MLDEIAKIIVDFRWLMILGLAVGGIMTFFAAAFTESLEWRKKRMRYFGLFYKLRLREAIHISVGLVRVLFVAMIVCFGTEMKTEHIVSFSVLCILFNVTRFKAKRAVVDFLNTVAIYIAMMVSNTLIGYLKEVSGDYRVQTIYILLAVFLVLYVVYFFAKDILDLLQEKVAAVQKEGKASLIGGSIEKK